MTDDLVERLRQGVLYGDARLHNPKGHDPLRMEAADRIEALEAENERLESALKRIAGGWPKPMQLARETLEKKK